jgi:hypothetical protein
MFFSDQMLGNGKADFARTDNNDPHEQSSKYRIISL